MVSPVRWWKLSGFKVFSQQGEWLLCYPDGWLSGLTVLRANHPNCPPDLLVTMREAQASLSSLKTGKAIGPDMIPNRVLKEFAPELALVITDIYNRSPVEGYVPSLLKSAIVNPLPKVSPPKEIKSDLRPIALTCTIAKVMEGFRTLTPVNTRGKGTLSLIL